MTAPKDGSALTRDEVRALGLKQLAESGIVESDLDALKIGFVTVADIRQRPRELPFAAAPGILHAYFRSDGEPNGVQRIRYLKGYEPPDPKHPGKFMRYGHPPGKTPDLYLAPTVPWLDIFANPSVELFFTEGWLKALAAVKFLGIPVLAYDGIWSFGKAGVLLPIYNEIIWRGRKVTFLNDKDVPENPESLRGENVHARLLSERSATVFIGRYPANSKVGKLDDALVAKGHQWVQQYVIQKAVEWDPSVVEDDIPAGLEEEPLHTAVIVPPLAASAMYGLAKELTLKFETPVSLTYPAILGMLASANLPTRGETRSTLYVVLLNMSGGGKSVITDRATSLVACLTRVLRMLPASDRGLLNMLTLTPPEQPVVKLANRNVDPKTMLHVTPSVLLVCDELVNLLSKANIENANLYSCLCDLFSHDEFGVADRKGLHMSSPVRFNLLGNLPCANPTEFSERFGSEAQRGFYRRCIFGLGLRAEPFEFRPVNEKLTLNNFAPTKLSIPAEMYGQVEAWKKQSADETQLDRRACLSEMILRVALITSSANGDAKVTAKAFDAAQEFIEWQEKIRTVYAPARTKSPYAQCMDMVMAYFEKSTGLVNWRDVAKVEHWYRREFSQYLKAVKNDLINAGFLIGHPSRKGCFYFHRKPESTDRT